MSEPAPNAGQPYRQDEIDEMFLAVRHLSTVPEKLTQTFAEKFGRTPGAIDLVCRWIHGAAFPVKAHNRIRRQVESARQRLGS